MDEVTLLLMVGGWGESPIERALGGAHQAAARDLLDTLLGTNLIDRAVIATDDAAWAKSVHDLPVEVDLTSPASAFHFGRRLTQLIEHCGAQRVLYSGGGSAPLMSAKRWTNVLRQLKAADRLVIANNLHSCDWVGFTHAPDAARWIAQQSSDNGLAWILTNQAAFPCQRLAPSAATRFDLDTPIDLLIARRHPQAGAHLRRYLNALSWHHPQLEAVIEEMGREGGSLLIAGRVSEQAWGALNRATRCWIRVFAEERGMRASGRLARGEVRSLLADYVDLVGIEGFFDELGSLANGALIDSRVLLAARGAWPSAADRFRADLYQWAHITHSFLQRFTRAAAKAEIPIVLGGHSIVAGGLMALTESFGENREETTCQR